MKQLELSSILKKYLEFFPEEKSRLEMLSNYIANNTISDLTDWNNFLGHIVTSGFVYSRILKQFLVVYHKDLQQYLYPGGHMNKDDINTLEAAKREVREETGLTELQQVEILDNKLIPIDIDIHLIPCNERLNLKEQYHFDFRYLFITDDTNINVDAEELSCYKWVSLNELNNFGPVKSKLKMLLSIDGKTR